MLNQILSINMENENTLNTVPNEDTQPILDVNTDTNANTGETNDGIAPEIITPEIIAEEIVAEEIVAEEIIEKPEEVVEVEAIEEPVKAEETIPETVESPVVEDVPVIADTTVATEIVEEKTEEKVEEEDEEDDSYSEFSMEAIDHMSPEELVVLLEETVKHKAEKIKSKVSAIRNSFSAKTREEKAAKKQLFIDNGGVAEEYTDEPTALENRFNEAFKIYKSEKARLNEILEKQKIENVAIKNELLAKLKDLVESNDLLKTTYDSFKEIQETWKKVGPVPQSEINNLWQNYHFYVERFFDKVKINKELRDLDLKKNLEQKIQLCEKVEELLLENSINKSFKLLQQYHDEWKAIGHVIEDKKEEIWERFKNASDTINLRRKDHYEEMQTEFLGNYNAKLVLCDKAEEITIREWNTIKEWNDVSEEVSELLKVWKTLGPAPKKLNDEVWETFKSKLDLFFANKKAFLQKVKESQLNNYNLKINLCNEAESIATRTDWKKATEDLLKLQKEWKDIGSVPKKYSDQIWKRFRAACDGFFAAKSAHFSSQFEHEDENLKLKEELLEKIKSFEMGDNRNENLNTLKEYQRQWMEIGHVPAQDKDRLYKSFKELINAHWEILKASASETRSSNYKSYVNDLMDNGDGNHAVEKERRFLQNKLTKLKEDISIWENNLGFFAVSKNAQLLIQEFNKKIENAKLEVKEIEEKLKIIQK